MRSVSANWGALHEAMEIPDPMFALLASQWPGFASVRVEPGFMRILKKIGWDRPFDGAGA